MKLKQLLLALPAALVGLTPLVCAAATASVNCPAIINTTQTMVSTPQEFQVSSKHVNHYLEQITFFSGKPSENASLVPDRNSNGKAIWTFSADTKGYISCGYYKTYVELFKPLPANTRSCVVIYDLNAQGSVGPIPKKITCEVG